MNIALWIVAGVLASAYLIGGIVKLALPRQTYATYPTAGWANDFSTGAFKLFGVLEVLAGIGLILPAALDIAPGLVPWAAVGAVLYMTGATVTRIRRGEFGMMAGDLVFLALAAFVAWGRFGPESFT